MAEITAKVHWELGGCMMQKKPEWELPKPERTEPQTTNRRRGSAWLHTIAIISPQDGGLLWALTLSGSILMIWVVRESSESWLRAGHQARQRVMLGRSAHLPLVGQRPHGAAEADLGPTPPSGKVYSGPNHGHQSQYQAANAGDKRPQTGGKFWTRADKDDHSWN